MKTISGSVTSSKPVSLSTAASHLKRFVAADMGVPPALSVYVKRTASAFNELVRLHKDANRRHRKTHRAGEENGNPETEIGEKEIDLAEGVERGIGDDQVESGIGGKEKRKKKNVDVNETVGVVEEKTEERKKRKKEEIEDSGEKQTMKKKKKRKLGF